MQTPPASEPGLRIFLPIALTCILIAAILITGCTSQTATNPTPGQQTSSAVISISEIIKNPSIYNQTEVLVRGKIVNECGSGCWFMLSDGTGTLYVDLTPNNFAIPQISGTTVVVHGIIDMKNGDPSLVATKVVTDSRTYP